MIAHVGRVPVEEFLLPFVSWGGAGVLVVRSWMSRVGRRRNVRVRQGVSGVEAMGIEPTTSCMPCKRSTN